MNIKYILMILLIGLQLTDQQITIKGYIIVKYREIQLGNQPPIQAPSFSIKNNDITYPLLLNKSVNEATLKHIANNKNLCNITGNIYLINNVSFIFIKSIEVISNEN